MKLTDKRSKKQMQMLFAATYLVSYIARINYGAVIVEIVRAQGIFKSQAALAVTGSALAYGAGQLLSGYIGDKVQPKKLIFWGLGTTAAMNLLLPFCANHWQMAVIWSLNGLAQDFMWPPLTKLMTALFIEKDYQKTSVLVSTGGMAGTLLVYLSAPLLISALGWKAVFIFSALCAVAMAGIWLHKCPVISLVPNKLPQTQAKEQRRPPMWLLMLVCILFTVVLQGALKDGVTTWTPSLLSETFGLRSDTSIFTGVLFPIFSIAIYNLVLFFYRKTFHNELALAGLFFAAGFAVALVLALFGNASALLSALLSAVLIGCMHGTNLMLTCMMPPHVARYGRVSLVFGTFNACAYVGSVISAYGMAAWADCFGWNSMLYVWSLIALAGFVLCFAFAGRWRVYTKTPH